MTTLKPLPPCKFCGEKDVLDQAYAYCAECMALRPVPTSKDNRRSDPWRTQAEEALREAKKALERIRNEDQFDDLSTNCPKTYVGHIHNIRERNLKTAREALARIEALRKER